MADKLINVKASTVQEFMDAGHKAMRDDTKLGDTSYDLQPKFTFGSDKKVTKGTMKLKVEVTRVHWAGPSGGTAEKAHVDAIKEIESLNQAHEDAHRDSYEKVFDKLQDKLEKEMVGKTQKEAQAVVDKMRAAMKDACEKLHKSGGQIDFDDDGKGTIKVTESAEGPGGCE